jgi:hypothetical protein
MGHLVPLPPARFDGAYSPNYGHLVARFRVSVKERALLAFHFESDLPAGFKVGGCVQVESSRPIALESAPDFNP